MEVNRRNIVLFSLDPRVGFHGKGKPLETNDGRILVCLAQGGECRRNTRYYDTALGLHSEKSWTAPSIHADCSHKCCYRKEVASPEDEGAYSLHASHDPYGFGWYKPAQDRCRYKPAEGEDWNHKEWECPQCSKPVIPSFSIRAQRILDDFRSWGRMVVECGIDRLDFIEALHFLHERQSMREGRRYW